MRSAKLRDIRIFRLVEAGVEIDAKFSTVELLRDLKTVTHAAARAPVAITQHRKPRFVLMALEDFDRLQAKNADPRRSYRISETPPRLRQMMEAGLNRIIAPKHVADDN